MHLHLTISRQDRFCAPIEHPIAQVKDEEWELCTFAQETNNKFDRDFKHRPVIPTLQLFHCFVIFSIVHRTVLVSSSCEDHIGELRSARPRFRRSINKRKSTHTVLSNQLQSTHLVVILKRNKSSETEVKPKFSWANLIWNAISSFNLGIRLTAVQYS